MPLWSTPRDRVTMYMRSTPHRVRMPMGGVPWNASPYDGVSPWGMLACPCMDMHCYILWYPRIWQCLPIYRGPQHVRMHSRMVGYPSIWGCIPIYGATCTCEVLRSDQHASELSRQLRYVQAGVVDLTVRENLNFTHTQILHPDHPHLAYGIPKIRFDHAPRFHIS